VLQAHLCEDAGAEEVDVGGEPCARVACSAHGQEGGWVGG
jgi:hypothetical protein